MRQQELQEFLFQRGVSHVNRCSCDTHVNGSLSPMSVHLNNSPVAKSPALSKSLSTRHLVVGLARKRCCTYPWTRSSQGETKSPSMRGLQCLCAYFLHCSPWRKRGCFLQYPKHLSQVAISVKELSCTKREMDLQRDPELQRPFVHFDHKSRLTS